MLVKSSVATRLLSRVPLTPMPSFTSGCHNVLSFHWVQEAIASKYIIMMQALGIPSGISDFEANTLLFGKYSQSYSRRLIQYDDTFFRYPICDFLFCILYFVL
jgi:hypothetical protein